MIKLIFFFSCFFISVSVVAETIYKKTNSDGEVEFTDRKSKDSKKIKIRKSTTYQAPRLPALVLPTKKLSPTFSYSFKITQPANDTTVTNTSDIAVSILMSSPLKKGYKHQIRYQLAGQSKLSQSSSVTFKDIPRGTHLLEVSVVNNKGDVISPVVSSRVHLKRFFKKIDLPIRKPPTN